jgi:hypothetical protein
MLRPRQKHEDCVVIVFRYITGEDEDSAFRRFAPYLNGERGISLNALTSCLKEAGYMLTPFERDAADVEVTIEKDALREFWGRFQGEAVMFYTSGIEPIAHAVLVRSGGIVIDPAPSSPEEGEFFNEYFESVGGEIRIKSVSKVSQLSPHKASHKG